MISRAYRFAGRKVAVTGAYGGFGREMVQRIKTEGGSIIAIGRRADELQKLQETHGVDSCDIVVSDLSTESGQKDIVNALIDLNADSLVNNAGIFKENLATDIGREEYDAIMNTNCTAPLFISQGIARHWVQQNEGKSIDEQTQYNIVNISSCASLSPLKGHLVYGLAKSGMDYWTKHMALELGTKGIQINSVNATIINSEMGTGPRGYWGNALRRQWALDRIPMGRFGEVEEVVSITTYLLSNECRFLNGVNVPLEGGLLCGSSNIGKKGILDNIDPDFVTDDELQQLKREIQDIEDKKAGKR